ncbi:monoacylglycerol/Diacylglycerol O-acyltransferase isoform X1 [Danaus plexippus]|uniref:monoacylglycerol/Diacylglycerol O-acyltransferase isoform X1 n=1 Tax=Danaus plexippus TaxID=13037 RepID=UPI002AB102B1|nr:monoacylglycerol/Diacylglycerol O-acyltransferase isoform X1 [Danaus plexippus]
MVENQCKARPVKAFIMSDLLTKFDSDATNDIVKVAVVVVFCLLYLEYVDTEYSLWLSWFLTPVIVTFLLPAVIIVLIYVSSIIFHLYRLYRLRVVDGVHNDWRHAARLAVCALWDAHGWLWHGYEIRGFENIPDGPFLLIYYHGALPIDMYYFIARMLLFKRRHIHTVADRFMFKIPGWSSLLEGLCVIPGTVQTCAGVLRSGNSLAISPGGVYEAQFGDHYYKLNWKSRIGFAKVALEAKVPIVPMFTQNVREAFRTVGWLRGICLRIYAATRVPLAPVYGGFPVKLVTHVGTPIPYDASLTPETLQVKVASAIEDLVEEHQRVPGSILLALIERVYEMPKKKKVQTNGSCHNGVAKQNNFPDKCDTDRSDVDPVKSDVDSVKSDVDSGKCDSDRSDKKVS